MHLVTRLLFCIITKFFSQWPSSKCYILHHVHLSCSFMTPVPLDVCVHLIFFWLRILFSYEYVASWARLLLLSGWASVTQWLSYYCIHHCGIVVSRNVPQTLGFHERNCILHSTGPRQLAVTFNIITIKVKDVAMNLIFRHLLFCIMSSNSCCVLHHMRLSCSFMTP